MSTALLVCVSVALYTSYTRHSDESITTLLFSLDMTLVLCIVIVSGFSRLSTLTTLVIASVIFGHLLARWLKTPASSKPPVNPSAS